MNSNGQMTMGFWVRVRHVWVHGFLIGLLFGALGIGAYYFFTSLPFFLLSENAARPLVKSQSEETLPATPDIFPQQQLTPGANLEIELVQVIKGIKEATLNKDLDGLMKLYSSSFPNLIKKEQRIIKSWKIYDYQKMDFKIHEIKPLTDDSAVAWITWDIAGKELSTGKIKNFSKTYQVTFVKESENWHILGLKNALW